MKQSVRFQAKNTVSVKESGYCDSNLNLMNWSNLPALLAIGRYPTLRAAARKLGISPATLSRQLDELQAEVGQALVERLPIGCRLTAVGERVVSWASEMEAMSFEIERLRDVDALTDVQGVVRINADDWLSFLVTPHLKELRKRHPQLAVEVITSHRAYNLLRREADIVIGYDRPMAEDIVTRQVGALTFGLFGSTEYIKERASLVAAEDWANLDFVGFDELRSTFDAAAWQRGLPQAPTPWLRCSYALGIYDGVVSGAGLGVLAEFAHQGHTGLVAIRGDISELRRTVWLSAHRSLAVSGRVKATLQFLAEVLEQNLLRT